MNWKEKQWYHFDDSSCSKTAPNRVVSDSAYNLFYRRKDYINLDDIDYETIRLKPDEKYL